MKYIYHHLGLGDHIICNGLVRSLINPNENYSMFVKSHNLTSVKFMYRDLPNLSFIVGDDFFVSMFISENKINNQNLIKIGFTNQQPKIEFDEQFYLQKNLPFSYRWDKFYVDRDLDRETQIFNHYNVEDGNYVFLHEDVSRNYVINRSHIIHNNLQIIEPIKDLTDNIFDYCLLMEKSIESHFIDSSFRLVFDSLKLRNSNLFYHINLSNNVIKDIKTKSNSILNFKII